MPAEPAVKRTIAFVDGQNLYHTARNDFGYTYPNYDVQKLAQAVCASRGWTMERVRFYTGVPSPADNAFWHGFWSNKLAMMGRRGVVVFSRPWSIGTRRSKCRASARTPFSPVRKKESTCGSLLTPWMQPIATI